jgi:hypothetical protein
LLDGPEQILIQERRMLCRADLALEVDLTDVEAVTQEIGERASGEGDTADSSPSRGDGCGEVE